MTSDTMQKLRELSVSDKAADAAGEGGEAVAALDYTHEMTAASELQAAIAVFDKSAERTTPNVQTAAWATIKPALLAALRDAERWRWMKANVSGGSFGTGDGSWLDDNVEQWDAAIDAALAGSG